MLKNVSYNDDKTINEIDDFVGKPFSIFERLKIGGIGSSKLLITKTDSIMSFQSVCKLIFISIL